MPDTQPEPAPDVTVLPPEPATEPEPVEPVNSDLYDWSQHLPEADEAEPAPLPTHKDDLVALAIGRGIPSYEAWAMTVPALTKTLKG